MRMSMTARLGRHWRTSRISSDPSPARPTTSYPPPSSRLARPSRINTSSSATMTRVPRGSTSVTATVFRSTIGGTRLKVAGEGELPTTDQNADRVAGRKVGRRSMVGCAMPSPWVAVEAGTDLFARARQIQRSWDRLLGEGALGPDLPPQATAGMLPTIVVSGGRGVGRVWRLGGGVPCLGAGGDRRPALDRGGPVRDSGALARASAWSAQARARGATPVAGRGVQQRGPGD